MKKVLLVLTLIIMASSLNSCFVSQSKYDYAIFQRDSLQNKVDSLNTVIKERDSKIDELKNRIVVLDNDVSTLKQTMNRLENEMLNAKENYLKLKSTASNETQSYMNQIEEQQKKIAQLQKQIAEKEGKIADVLRQLNAREAKMKELREKIEKSLLGFKESGLSVYVKDNKVYVSLSNQLLFASGSTQIDKKGQEALKNLADVLNTQSDINVLVEGHTDNQAVTGTTRFKDNWELSVLRATEVVKYLTVDGAVDATRVTASGRGEYFPIEAGDSKEVRAKNRRTEIILSPKLDILFEMIK